MSSDGTPRNTFQKHLRAIAGLHKKGTGGIRVGLALTEAMDSVILETFQSFKHPSKSSICIACLGGYGRKELCFASDTDIMFLLPQGNSPDAGFAVQKLLHAFLDLGLDIGHSVRTIEDCLSLRMTDAESWVSLLEARFLCGNKPLFGTLRKELQRQIDEGNRAVFIQDFLARQEGRHRKYGESTKLLEPNIKNSAGGLRDLHTALWLLLGSGTVRLFGHLPDGETTITLLLRSPFLKRHFPPRRVRETREAFDMLLRTRNTMHLEARSLHDSLEFTFQRQVADSLGFPSRKTRSSVEQFMQEYYVSSRRVARFSRRVGGLLQREFLKSSPADSTRLDDTFALRNNQVVLRSKTTIGNTTLLRALLHAVRNHATLSGELEDLIEKHEKRLRGLASKTETALFREFLSLPQGIARTLQALNELGVFERWIPEWKPLVAFFQHNQYHYYTADEHTLRVVASAEALADDRLTLGGVFRSLPRRDTLVLACLLHDIAKPKRVGDHEITGAGIARTVLNRLRCADIADDVVFLVRNHLLMEHVAFRRNLSDPQTIIDFSRRIPRPYLLDYLYVLTYADLSAVNKTVWTDWKGMLLFELYRKTKEVLEQRLSGSQVRQADVSRRDQAVQELVQTLAGVVPEQTSQEHLRAVENSAYLTAFNAQEIAEHIRRIQQSEPATVLFNHQGTMTEVTVIARDQPYALSRFCGVLSANDANILDAHIFTRTDGVIIDKFRVSDFLQHTKLSEDQCGKIRQELIDVMTGNTDVNHLLERHRLKWKRLTRAINPNTRLAVEFEDHPLFCIIDVFAPDRLGFLYKVTETLSAMDLDIASAKIATRADGIVDSFYVVDRKGRDLRDPRQRARIRETLLGTISELTESELAPVQS